jgi:hypothetical protein
MTDGQNQENLWPPLARELVWILARACDDMFATHPRLQQRRHVCHPSKTPTATHFSKKNVKVAKVHMEFTLATCLLRGAKGQMRACFPNRKSVYLLLQ